MINWKVRIKNKAFWMTFIPALLLLVTSVAAVFGFTIDLTDISGKLLAAIEALFVVLAICGVVNDPTTAGMGDSRQALTYERPRKDGDANVINPEEDDLK